ncbi:MAG TPA: hypothetical protein VGE07_01500 [Herpetosiphonaceae bacterium]
MSANEGVELLVAKTWLVTTLRADATLAALGIHERRRPPGATGIVGVVRLLDPGLNTNALGGSHILARPTFLVEFCYQGSADDPLAPYVILAHSLVNKQRGLVPALGGEIFSCIRLRSFEQTEFEAATEWRRLGNVYQLGVGNAS